jgi:hypothetical protein
MPSLIQSLLLLPTALLSIVFASPLNIRATNTPQIINLRIEGADSTIYEGPILTKGHNVTTPSGGTHHCDGTNNNANPTPGATCTSALSDASKLAHFPFDGTFDTAFDDFFITSIGDSTQTATEFWGLLLDYQFTPVGGCQQEVETGAQVLWAFNAFNAVHFLKLTGPNLAVKGKPFTVTVVDGSTGLPVAGATVAGATTNSTGQAVITPAKLGLESLKAQKSDSIRSNALEVIVA